MSDGIVLQTLNLENEVQCRTALLILKLLGGDESRSPEEMQRQLSMYGAAILSSISTQYRAIAYVGIGNIVPTLKNEDVIGLIREAKAELEGGKKGKAVEALVNRLLVLIRAEETIEQEAEAVGAKLSELGYE